MECAILFECIGLQDGCDGKRVPLCRRCGIMLGLTFSQPGWEKDEVPMALDVVPDCIWGRI
eukprot:762742-Amphidinium_carterae.2